MEDLIHVTPEEIHLCEFPPAIENKLIHERQAQMAVRGMKLNESKKHAEQQKKEFLQRRLSKQASSLSSPLKAKVSCAIVFAAVYMYPQVFAVISRTVIEYIYTPQHFITIGKCGLENDECSLS
jgi:hypothetical protein